MVLRWANLPNATGCGVLPCLTDLDVPFNQSAHRNRLCTAYPWLACCLLLLLLNPSPMTLRPI